MHPLCQNVCIVAMLIASFSLTGCWSKTRSSGSTAPNMRADTPYGNSAANWASRYWSSGLVCVPSYRASRLKLTLVLVWQRQNRGLANSSRPSGVR